MKIPGYLFILVGVFVVVASLLIADLKVFLVVGGLFIIYGLARMGLSKLTKVLSPKEEVLPSQRLDAKDNPYLKPQEKIFGGQAQGQQHQQQQQQHTQRPVHHQQSQRQTHQQQPHTQRQAHQQQPAHHRQPQAVQHGNYAQCSRCGAKNMGHARFCNGCGSQLR
jgi:hypothetical protein